MWPVFFFLHTAQCNVNSQGKFNLDTCTSTGIEPANALVHMLAHLPMAKPDHGDHKLSKKLCGQVVTASLHS